MCLFLKQKQTGNCFFNLKMILHKKFGNPYGLFLVLILIAFISLPKSIKNYKNIMWDFYEKAATFDIGSSSIHELAEGSLKDPKSFLTILKKTPKVVNNILFGVSRKEQIPDVYIDIKFKNFKKLIKDRDSALYRGIGYNYEKVKAEITFEGRKLKSNVRLKGQLLDHWRSKYRMSLRVKIKGDNTLFGYKEFSVHKPSARQHPYDQSFQDLQRNLGNISSKHSYINLYVNGEDWGIMNIEEHLTKEFLEKQKHKESLIIEFGNEKHDIYKRTVDNIYDEYRISDPYLNVNVLDKKKYINQKKYRKWFSYISKEHLKFENKLYDNESFTKSLFLSMIWNNMHSLYHQNSRYYFNPYNLKLYPITTDQSFFSPIKEKFILPKPYEKIVSSDLFKTRFKENHKNVKKAILKSQVVIDKWQDYFPLDIKISSNVLLDNENIIFNNFHKFLIEKKESEKELKYNKIDEVLSKNLMDHIYAKHFDNGQIHIYNLTREKVKIKNIFIDGKRLKGFESTIIEGQNPLTYVPLIINTSLKGLYDNRIEIKTEIFSFDRSFTLGFSHISNDIHNPLLYSNELSEIEFLEKIDDNNYKVKKGTWYIKNPLFIKKNLLIEKGTELVFNEKSYLIINGSLRVLGDKDNNVVLRSNNGYWKGIYVFESKEKSILKNVKILNVTFLKDGILDLTGSINFYKSDVKIIDSFFENSNAEDFLNIVHSEFILENVSINNSISDAFDSDFSTGTITGSSFFNISGDGIDFSGSKVSIKDTFFKNIRDKAISVGEESSLSVNNISVDSVGIGVASKDGSLVRLERSNFSNYNLNALMTYQKKSFYGNPSLIGKNVIFDSKEDCCLRQIESNMKINDKIIDEQEIDVSLLYENKIMKK